MDENTQRQLQDIENRKKFSELEKAVSDLKTSISFLAGKKELAELADLTAKALDKMSVRISSLSPIQVDKPKKSFLDLFRKSG